MTAKSIISMLSFLHAKFPTTQADNLRGTLVTFRQHSVTSSFPHSGFAVAPESFPPESASQRSSDWSRRRRRQRWTPTNNNNNNNNNNAHRPFHHFEQSGDGRSSLFMNDASLSDGTSNDPSPPILSTAAKTHDTHRDERKGPWTDNWFPIAFEEFLFRDKPTRHYLLGSPIVVWFHNDDGGDDDDDIENSNTRKDESSWKVMLDICPHRLAPLSEGRILKDGPRKGCIECPYHGWAFDGSGDCVHIPQLQPQMPASSPSSSSADATSSGKSILSKASGVSLPAVVKQGILWVHSAPLFQSNNGNFHLKYGNQSSSSFDYSPNPSDIDKYLVPQLEYEGVVYADYFRDLPMEWSTLVENVIDPSHLPYTHHGTIGRRPVERHDNNDDDDDHNTDSDLERTKKKSPATPLKVITPITPSGFSAIRTTANPGTVDFVAPSLVVSCTDRRKDKDSSNGEGNGNGNGNGENPFRDWNVAYAIPTLPGKCRLLVRVAFETGAMTNPMMKAGFDLAFGDKAGNGGRGNSGIPKWILHVRNHEILEDDNVFLHYQMMHYRSVLGDGHDDDDDDNNDDGDGDGDSTGGGDVNNHPRKQQIARKEKVSYLPTDSDATVLAFHKWHARFGDVDSMWTRYTPRGTFLEQNIILSKKELLDRSTSHTDQCASCHGAKQVLLNQLEPGLRMAMGAFSFLQIWVLSNEWTVTSEMSVESAVGILPVVIAGIAYVAREVVLSIVKSMEDGVYPPRRNR